MVYSTCTFAPCENEGVVAWVLENYPEMELQNINLDGLSDANGKWVSSNFDLTGAKRIFPHISKGEGHFVALFKKNGDEIAKKQTQKSSDLANKYKKFEKENLNTVLDGQIIAFGENLYLLPDGINIDKIKVELAGLYLGTAKKNRFVPSHALCLALQKGDFKRSLEVSYEDAGKFIHGETLKTETAGWTAVLYSGYPIGWGKGADGMLKNHFPKNLRF